MATPTAPTEPDVDLAHPFTPERLKTYLWVGGAGSAVGGLFYLGVLTGILPPNRTVDVLANIFTFIPMVLLPVLVYALTKPGVGRAAELTLVWLPFTAAAQLSFELVWLVGQLFNTWQPVTDPGWQWLWWQFALTDTRYFGENPFIFGLELTAVVAASFVLYSWLKLIKPELSDRDRLKHLWISGIGLTALTGNTVTYFASAARNGLDDVGQGTYGIVKFICLNGPYLVAPLLVLAAMWRQSDYLLVRNSRP